MRRSIRSELRMLRELVWHFCIERKCYFCKKALLIPVVGTEIQLGEFRAPPVKTKITIHHDDEDHWNNKKSNRKICHASCHKAYHMKLRQKELRRRK